MAVVEIELRDGKWHSVIDSPFNRRITGYTAIDITGPLSGDPLLQTSGGYDDSGTKVLGMLNNCAGGKTPWGTVLSCEENFDLYFANFGGDELSLRLRAGRDMSHQEALGSTALTADEPGSTAPTADTSRYSQAMNSL